MYEKFYRALKPGGALFVSDLVEQSQPVLQKMIWARYGAYLVQLKKRNLP